ncbi:MAG: N-acetylmuramoyl-L-alanine amidase [Chloroflexi bacterium]|nr:N-acetylmuramoyl-L-alanine amidase [Chloroflexota bacterium]
MVQLSVQFVNIATSIVDSVRAAGEHIARIKLVQPPTENPFTDKVSLGRVMYINGNTIDEGSYIAQGAAGADRWWNDIAGFVDARPWISEWEFINEPSVNTPTECQNLAACTLRWMQLAKARGLTGTVLNFSQGTPELDKPTYFADVVRYAAANGFTLGFHEYWYGRIGNPSQEGWNYLRFPKFFKALRDAGVTEQPNVSITECGIDGGVVGKTGGWRDTIGEGDYAADLVTYRNMIAQYAYVKSAYIFCAGNFGAPWNTFDITQTIMNTVAASNPLEQPPTPTIIKEPPIVIDGRNLSSAQFARHLQTIHWSTAPTAIYLHHSYEPSVANWRGKESLYALKAYYETIRWTDAQGQVHEGWTSGPHIFTAPDGIWLFSDLLKDGTHVAGHNHLTLGVVMVGNYNTYLPSGPVLDNTVAALALLCNRLGIDPSNLRFHREDEETSCPGNLVTKAWLVPQVKVYAGRQAVLQEAESFAIAYMPANSLYKYIVAKSWLPASDEFNISSWTYQWGYDSARNVRILCRCSVSGGAVEEFAEVANS